LPGTVVIAGASIAGVRTAQALRAEGHEGRIVVVGAEDALPYDKPPLSKQFLAGAWEPGRLALLTAEAAADLDVELLLGVPAEHLDVAGQALVLAGGRRLDYDAVVLATGAAARPSPWQPASGLHVLRTLADSRALRAALAEPGPVVIVGAGFIGSEVAATARAGGHEVTLVDPLPVPMGRIVGAEVGTVFERLHRRHGAETRFGTGVQDVTGRAGELRVTLTDGTVLPAATVVVGIGARPVDGWLAASGLLVEDGVVCDQYCRAVDRANVFAAGDLARWYHPGYDGYQRVEHWTNAVDQAACVAHNLVHPRDLRDYAPVEYIWSDQYDWRIQLVGRPQHGGQARLTGDPEADRARFAVLYADETGGFAGAMTVNWPKALIACRRGAQAGVTFAELAAQLDALPAPK
jgi:phthalate 3,4-dioxygenase ferredoxin reductase subunit